MRMHSILVPSRVHASLCSSVWRIALQAKLERKDHMTLFAFSLLFNVNIWLSNYSLNLVTMAMHQVVRALVPAFTVMLSIPFLGKT